MTSGSTTNNSQYVPILKRVLWSYMAPDAPQPNRYPHSSYSHVPSFRAPPTFRFFVVFLPCNLNILFTERPWSDSRPFKLLTLKLFKFRGSSGPVPTSPARPLFRHFGGLRVHCQLHSLCFVVLFRLSPALQPSPVVPPFNPTAPSFSIQQMSSGTLGDKGTPAPDSRDPPDESGGLPEPGVFEEVTFKEMACYCESSFSFLSHVLRLELTS